MSQRTAVFALLVVCLASTPAAAQITGVSPSSATTTNVTAVDDWATRVLQDPMDMKQNTDLAWNIWSKDQPIPTLTNIGFNVTNSNGSGLFHADSTGTNNFLQLLQSSNRFSADLGRTGAKYPIDASYYSILSFRMCLTDNHTDPNGQHVRLRTESGGLNATFNNSVALVFRTPGDFDIPGTTTQDGSFPTYAGCQIYTVNMAALPKALNVATWSGNLQWLRFDPTYIGGVGIDIDWIRLARNFSTNSISWSGGAADIYLDNNNVASDGNLGMLYKDGALARGVTSPYTFQMSALEGGAYYVRICPQDAAYTSSSCAYTGVYNVNSIPTIQVTAPSEEGSSDDFATIQLNNAWDFDALTDIDYSQNIASMSIDTAFPAQRPDGTDLGNIRVLKGTPSSSNPGDPYFYTLWFAGNGRGVTKKIDADRYRILTAEMGLPGARDINGGSIARIVWKTTAETAENVSQDIIVNHRAGVNILDTINVDLKTLALETDATAGTPAGFHGTAGWNGQIENFRFDPHEFTPITDFWVKRIKLAALETIGATMTYTIKWSAADTFDSTNTTPLKVSASYVPSNAAGTAIVGGLTAIATCAGVTASTGQCTWNTGSVVAGKYYIQLSITDGVNTNTVFSKYPVVVDNASTPKPRIVLDRSLVNFGGTASGTVTTPPQQVKLSIVGSGTVNWTATTSGTAANLFCVSKGGAPAQQVSGSGSATLSISICSTNIYDGVVGNLGTLVVTSAEADNSPQAVTVYLKMTANGANPFGGFDTPADNATLQGSVAVTGWALDDIGIAKVDILRDAHPNDPAGAVVNGKVFVATATLVEGARGDIVSLFPNSPVNYNAGWGYLMLTRGLIWDGKGPFKLYAEATDVEGHKVTLGSKTVVVDNNNAAALKPFGSIDTPNQGETVSGTINNFGWGLTPGTCTIQSNGVQVSIDSGPLQPVVYGDARPDIAGGFKGFTNTSNAGGHYTFDSTQLTDGVHTIGWLITDDCGRADGVGSRFFKTSNGVLGLIEADAKPALAGASTVFARLGEPVEKLRAASGTLPVSFSLGVTARPVFRRAATADGRSELRIREFERMTLTVGAPAKDTSYAAYRVVDGRLRFLPIGSSFDTARGTFYWQPAPGFVGDYDFVFVKTVKGREVGQSAVRVTVGPSTATLRASLFRSTDTAAVVSPETR